MAEETSVNISGTFKDIDAASVNISGTFKVVGTIFANVAGTWKEVWNATNLTLVGLIAADPITNVSVSNASRKSQASLRVDQDGSVYKASGNTDAALIFILQGDWLDGGTPSLFEARMDQDSQSGDGHTFFGSTLGVWVDLNSGDATWTCTIDDTGEGISGAECTVQIREKLDTANSISRSGMTFSVQLTL